MQRLLCVTAVLGLALLAGPGARGADKDHPKEAEALKQRAEEFIKAFEKGDSKALAGFYRTLDPSNTFNPGIGQTSKARGWGSCDCDGH